MPLVVGFLILTAFVHALVLSVVLNADENAVPIFFVFFTAFGICQFTLLRSFGPRIRGLNDREFCHRLNSTEASFVVCSMSVFLVLLAPHAEKARAAARRSNCRNNLIQHSGSHPPTIYRGLLHTCPVCTDKLPDGTSRPVIFIYDVKWPQACGDPPEPDSTAHYSWPRSSTDGYFHGQMFVSSEQKRTAAKQSHPHCLQFVSVRHFESEFMRLLSIIDGDVRAVRKMSGRAE